MTLFDSPFWATSAPWNKEKAARKSHDQFVRKGKDSDLYKEEKKKGSMRGSFDKARASLDSINSDK